MSSTGCNVDDHLSELNKLCTFDSKIYFKLFNIYRICYSDQVNMLFPNNLYQLDKNVIIVIDSSAVDRMFESLSDQFKNYKISICCFSNKHTKTGWF